MPKYTLYTHPFTRGFNALWMLHECDADYDIIPLHYGDEMKSLSYLTINPMGKVPALTIGDTVITETPAILMYLADAHPDKALIPPVGSTVRGEFYRWMYFAVQVEYAMMDKRRSLSPNADEKRSLGYGSYEDVMATLRDFLMGKTYALGDGFSALDVYLVGMIDFGQMAGLIDDDVLINYAKALHARAGYVRTEQVTGELVERMGLGGA